jgi:plasmid maintenance system killer protein
MKNLFTLDTSNIYYKLNRLYTNNNDIPNDNFIIGLQHEYNQKLIYKYSILNAETTNEYLNNTNHNAFEVLEDKKNIYYKLFIDVDYTPNDKNDLFFLTGKWMQSNLITMLYVLLKVPGLKASR